MLWWTSINPREILFSKFIAPRRCADSKMIVAPVFILLQHASPGVVETAPKAQAKTTWWHDPVDHFIDVLVSPQSTGGHAHLVLSRFCLSLGMESDLVFHDLFVAMQPMPVVQAVLPIPSLNALPVHRANQMFFSFFLSYFANLNFLGFQDVIFSLKFYYFDNLKIHEFQDDILREVVLTPSPQLVFSCAIGFG